VSAGIQARIHNIFLGGLVPGTYLMSLSNARVLSLEGMDFLLGWKIVYLCSVYVPRYGICLIPTTGQRRISICSRHLCVIVSV
jgi:hypothetical protein